MVVHADARRMVLLHSLRNATIFAGLPTQDLERMAEYAVLKRLKKGEYLFREDEQTSGFFIVRTGVLNVHRTSPDGREQVIHMFRAGESLAEVALVGEGNYPANARSVGCSEVILIPRRTFLEHQRARPDLSLRMLVSMSHHLRVLVSALENLRLRDAETRFVYWLMERCPRPWRGGTVEVDIGMSKASLAGELGTRQETLSRIFAKLRKAGIIEIKKKSIFVSAPDSLATFRSETS